MYVHDFIISEHSSRSGARSPGRELALTLRRGAAGFGFTIADSVHGQKVKKVNYNTLIRLEGPHLYIYEFNFTLK